MCGRIITELQSLGVRTAFSSMNRRVGAGPAEGVTLLLDGLPVNVPSAGRFAARSPYKMEGVQGELWLTKDGNRIVPVKTVSRPRFYDYVTRDGAPYPMIALLHGNDCVASTVIQTCVLWNSERRCRFCGIELSLATHQTLRRKYPKHLAEVIARAKEVDHVSHVVLTTGNCDRDKEIDYLCECAKAIQQVCKIPVHAQFKPPENLTKLSLLKKSGVATVGIHVETFNPVVLSHMAPAKASIGLEKYKKTWHECVKIFGPNQVSSFLLVGLGEDDDSIIEGSAYLAEIGVYPFVVPFRPIPGSLMQDHPTPDPRRMERLYLRVVDILCQAGLAAEKSLAGCVRCGACSALRAFEAERREPIICRPVQDDIELMTALEIRKEVFVNEQRLFEVSDIDENDTRSVHIIALHKNEIIGVVRVFCENNNFAHWVGGRLAVRKDKRHLHAGALLVRAAVSYVKKQGCTRFRAHIQKQNVPFFQSLNWKAIGPLKSYHGILHQIMEADLGSRQ
ncbi:MAG: MSMEG_0568 family radical SAM protein, partial [Desulfomonilaceae bacterium]